MKSKLLFILFLFCIVANRSAAQKPDFWNGIETFDGPTDENPILASQIDFYFDRLVSPLPDSITQEISQLIDKTSSNTDLRDFILWYLLQRYQHPDYITQDQVFVWLYDTYFSQLEIKDLNEANLELIREKAERLRRLALFNPAPDFQWKDFEGLQTIKSPYTVLFFYDHDCEVCQQELHDLDSVVQQRSDITSVAIDLNTEDTEGLGRIYEAYDIETTPLLYVLDREKRIIAKKIRANQIDLIISN